MKKKFLYLVFLSYVIFSLITVMNLYKNKESKKDTIKILENKNIKTKGKFTFKTTNSVFQLQSKDSIFIYYNEKTPNKIKKLTVYSHLDTKTKCLEIDNIKNVFQIKIQDLLDACEEKSTFFQGILKIENYDDIYFYFALANKKILENLSKNLLVLPITNFYNYSSSITEINRYTNFRNLDVDYIALSTDVPNTFHKRWTWGPRLFDSIKNLKTIFKNFDVKYDFELENLDLNKYKNIIFPLHQEYISHTIFEKLVKFLDEGEGKNIISIGGNNFRREVEFVFQGDNLVRTHYKKSFMEPLKYNFHPSYKKQEDCKIKDGTFSTSMTSGELSNPFSSKNSEHFFYDIMCDEIKLPLITVTKFNKGKLIHFNSDTAGEYFLDSKKLYKKFIELVN